MEYKRLKKGPERNTKMDQIKFKKNQREFTFKLGSIETNFKRNN